MSPDRSEPVRTDDRGCLQWVLAVPVVILDLLAAGFCFYAVTIRPHDAWDRDAVDGIIAMCVLTIATSAVTVLFLVVPSVRRVMNRWWFAPPLVLAGLATVRWALLG
ncbi:hypothetical protein [Streptomyces sp. NPDC001970]